MFKTKKSIEIPSWKLLPWHFSCTHPSFSQYLQDYWHSNHWKFFLVRGIFCGFLMSNIELPQTLLSFVCCAWINQADVINFSQAKITKCSRTLIYLLRKCELSSVFPMKYRARIFTSELSCWLIDGCFDSKVSSLSVHFRSARVSRIAPRNK